VDTKVEVSAANIEAGTQSTHACSTLVISFHRPGLKEADRLQTSARKKYIIIALLILCIVGTIVAIFVVLRFVHLI
jgi:hypothetical protein